MKRALIIFFLAYTLLTPYVNAATDNTALIQQLLAQIAVLRAELAKLQGTPPSCTFTRLLHYGVKGTDVTCLQNYLKAQGYFTEIPNGNYGPYTMDAASRWQKASGIIAEPKEYGLWGEQSRAVYARKIATKKVPASVAPSVSKTPVPIKKEKIQTDIDLAPAKTIVAPPVIVKTESATSTIQARPVVTTPVSNVPVITKDNLPIFPGAVGFGTHTRAGRGGVVIEVTTLEDDGEGDGREGSLRRAIMTKGSRIIVFKVGGTIRLKASLYIEDPYVTIAGHTAPGEGITIRDFGIQILTHDVLMQHIRVRPGNEGAIAGDANDGINFLGKEYGGDIYNVVLDHVSVSWAEDENISMLRGLKDVTISNSIISEALNRSRHEKTTHSAGLLAQDMTSFSLVGNIFAHNGWRNPAITNSHSKSNMLGEVVNNVMYDWHELATEITNYADASGGYINMNIVGNTYRQGPSTIGDWPIMIGQEGFPKIYVKDNSAPEFEALLTPELALEHNVATGDYGLIGGNDVVVDKIITETRIKAAQFNTPAVKNARSPKASYDTALASAGASKPKRDAIDVRMVNDVRNKTGRIIDSPSEVGGYTAKDGGVPYVDTDRDGMSDEWERVQGLNSSDSTDGSKDKDNDGYTNVEEFLFSRL